MIAALDVGTSKVTCFIAERDSQGELSIIGIGQDTADGLKAGTVTDMAAAGKSIGTAVHRAEIMADKRVHELFVSVSGGAPQSSYANVSLDVSGRQIGNTDIQAAFDEARTDGAIDGREIVQSGTDGCGNRRQNAAPLDRATVAPGGQGTFGGLDGGIDIRFRSAGDLCARLTCAGGIG